MSTENSGGERGTDDLAWPGFAGLLREQWEAFRHNPLKTLLWRKLKWPIVIYFLLLVVQAAASTAMLFFNMEDPANWGFSLALALPMCLSMLALLILYFGILFLYGTYAHKRTWQNDETIRLTALTRRERVRGITAVVVVPMLAASALGWLGMEIQSWVSTTKALTALFTADQHFLALVVTLDTLASLPLRILINAFSAAFIFHHVTFRLLLREATRHRADRQGWWPVVRSLITHWIYLLVASWVIGGRAGLLEILAMDPSAGYRPNELLYTLLPIALTLLGAAVLYAWAAYFRRSYRKDMEKARGVLFVAEE